VVLQVFFGLLHRGLPAAPGHLRRHRPRRLRRVGPIFLAWLWLGQFALLVGVEIDLRLVGHTEE
jgi:hypothetical protein